ncbi:MAG: M3 family oligoendopeptidase [Nitrospirota bacterium]|jgi:oligoendopeptidase F
MGDETLIDVEAAEVAWDLTDLYTAAGAPEISRDLDAAKDRASAFDARYRGRLAAEQIDGAELHAAVAELEGISEILTKVLSYAHLLFAADTVTPAHGALLTACQERLTAINKYLMFFDLEWAGLPEGTAAALLADPAVSRYRHHLAKARAYAPYRLSEPEELLLDEKANTGNRAFSRLFDEILADARFPVATDGAVQELREEEVLALLHSPDRPARRAAAAGLTTGLLERRRTLTFIFNTLVLDHGVDCRLRRYPDVMTPRHLANETDGAAVEALLTACEAGLPIVARYYRLKRHLLGLDELLDYDRYAPLADATETIPWTRARDLVLAAYRAFSPRVATIAEEFFSRRWIDAATRPGKRGGAFCASTVPSVHPYVLLSYQGRPRDVQTLAHELGHGVHQYLARDRGLFAADTPLTTAETASVFGEMLVFQSLKEMLDDPRRRLSLVCAKIEDSFATVFRQAIMSRFEQSLHTARREEGELPSDRIDELWMAANRRMFGDSLQLTDDYRHWWMYIPHFIHSPFYTYAYSFGELLVLALFEKYNIEGEAFVPAYLDLLAAGGSAPPDELLARMGIDITADDFWQGGLAVLSRMVDEAEALSDLVA